MNLMRRSTTAAWLAGCIFVLALLAGCAAGVVRHSFSFDAREEPDIEVLDYRYGDSRQPSARANHKELRDGKVRQSVSIGGDIGRPDVLYVQWRVQSTGAIYEDSVDLARLLPRDINDHGIHFTVRGRQLFVYLVTTQNRNGNDPAIGPRAYQYRKVITLSSNFGRQVTNN